MWRYELRKFAVYLVRAMRLRCPTCGKRPIFVAWHRVRHLRDWLMPLDGCPSCGYPYEREAGYYLLATWAINYGFGSILGLALYFTYEWQTQLPLGLLLAAVFIPVFLFNLFFLRHSKAIFLAVDLYFDPHDRGGDGGGQRTDVPDSPRSGTPALKPDPPCGRPTVLR